MFHEGIINAVQQQLEQIGIGLAENWLADPAIIPDTLLYVADAAGIRDMIVSRTFKAVHSRSSITACDVGYGIALAESFLAARLVVERDPIRKNFCREVIANLNPQGSYFESFEIRLYEEAHAAHFIEDDSPGYGVVLRTAGMGISHSGLAGHGTLRLGKAVYAHAEQLARLASVYSACETCYVDAVGLYGEKYQENFLAACWDRFRQALGELSMLFRKPSLASEKEWVATALVVRPETERNNDNVEFAVRDNAFVPYVRVSMPAKPGTVMPGLPIEQIVIGSAVLPPAAEDGLRAFLRQHHVYQIAVKRASQG